ncbi:MAG TPA: pyridoxal-dependent decarboxylase, partial [Thermoanaerobaculia bacterium]|nr:pyridoxal-dependent decarboxylase [Thermoanaerobaculia bacterium]
MPADPSPTTAYPLEPSPEEMHRLVAEAMARIVPHLASLPDQPSADVAGAVEIARALSGSMPEAGRPFGEILDLLYDRAIPKSFNTAGPGYLAYIPGGGLFATAVADLIADTANRYTGVFAAAPVLSQLEADAIRFLADAAGYPQEARGFFTSGGSLANWSGLVTARRERLPDDHDDLRAATIYTSDQVHHSVVKAALLAGFSAEQVREIPTDARYCLRTDLLVESIAADRAASRRPFLIVASAGTTNTGAVDPLDELADVAAREDLWLHVDGAYGACFLL